MTNNKIQIVYRLSNRITLMWPTRPNNSNATKPDSYNVYWDIDAGGAFSNLLGNAVNSYTNNLNGNRSYLNKVVMNVIPSLILGWNNDITNYIRMSAVIGGVEQSAETVVTIAPYTTSGMRLRYPELKTSAIIGYNSDQDQFIPVSVDTSGKIITTT